MRLLVIVVVYKFTEREAEGGIKLRPGRGAKGSESAVPRLRSTGDAVKHIGNSEDSGWDGNVLPAQSIGISSSIPPLMMMGDQPCRLLEK